MNRIKFFVTDSAVRCDDTHVNLNARKHKFISTRESYGRRFVIQISMRESIHSSLRRNRCFWRLILNARNEMPFYFLQRHPYVLKCLSAFERSLQTDTRKMKPCQPKRPHHHHPPVISPTRFSSWNSYLSLSIRPLRLCLCGNRNSFSRDRERVKQSWSKWQMTEWNAKKGRYTKSLKNNDVFISRCHCHWGSFCSCWPRISAPLSSALISHNGVEQTTNPSSLFLGPILSFINALIPPKVQEQSSSSCALHLRC